MFYDVPKCFTQYLMILRGADFYDRLPDVQFCEGATIISAYIYFFYIFSLSIGFLLDIADIY